ncbi:MAG TPA: 16S rRNA (cytidine(1402)-2'-O)-methyltransferase [Deltaproteobacteria bacterium]|nr:16S rRNA (cytidine(1402)-2'-O)-methyltransferase [Deltaproteobacteria bacterium]
MQQRTKEEKGVLFIVATPIGNLEDITLRALRILKDADIICAEDTRRTRKLLNTYQIKTKLISLHGHNEKIKAASIISCIKDEKSVAYVTDAGTPCVSDPGQHLISLAHDENIRVTAIPGPSAVVAALSTSGFVADSFLFCGFIPAQKNKRRKLFTQIKEQKRTIVFYESPVRLYESLVDMRKVLGERHIVIARELTKIFEEITRCKLSEIISDINTEKKIKGEITLVVEGYKEKHPVISEQELKKLLYDMIKQNKTIRDAVEAVASQTGLPKKEVYAVGVKIKKDRFVSK